MIETIHNFSHAGNNVAKYTFFIKCRLISLMVFGISTNWYFLLANSSLKSLSSSPSIQKSELSFVIFFPSKRKSIVRHSDLKLKPVLYILMAMSYLFGRVLDNTIFLTFFINTKGHLDNKKIWRTFLSKKENRFIINVYLGIFIFLSKI